MKETIETRYVPSSLIRALSSGALHSGMDSYLNRKVLLYTINGQTSQSIEEYTHRLSSIAAFKHEGFHYILDTVFEENSALIVQEAKPGSLLFEEIQHNRRSFSEAVTLVTTLGISMLDAMERRIAGFSVGVDNLWISPNGRISILNYWDEGESHKQGAVGLCGLLIQMLAGKVESLGPYEALHTHLENTQIPSASKEQKDALVKVFKRVGQGHASLSSLIFGLQSLPASPIKEAAPMPVDTHIEQPIEMQKEPAPTRFYKFVGAGVFTIVFLGFIIWFLSSPPFLNRDETLPLKDAAKPTMNSANTPNPQMQSTAKPTVEPTVVTDVPQNPQQNEITAPTLVGLSKAEAEKQAVNSGLRYQYFVEPNNQAQGAVFKQDPEPGVNVSKGDRVTFWIGK